MRRYGKWAGRPNGAIEDDRFCVVEVMGRSGFAMFYQCCKKRGHGPDGKYCKLHARMLAEGKRLRVPMEETQ